jgi:hypothetical protein
MKKTNNQYSFISEENFELALARLNALGDEFKPWALTQAQKNHTDEFGEVIKAGDDYYKKSIGQAFDNNVKLSKKSMVRFAYLYFMNSNALENIADKVIKEKNEKLQRAVNSINL